MLLGDGVETAVVTTHIMPWAKNGRFHLFFVVDAGGVLCLLRSVCSQFWECVPELSEEIEHLGVGDEDCGKGSDPEGQCSLIGRVYAVSKLGNVVLCLQPWIRNVSFETGFYNLDVLSETGSQFSQVILGR
jgi:hypothetical protein